MNYGQKGIIIGMMLLAIYTRLYNLIVTFLLNYRLMIRLASHT
jgi:hypothetical protein